MQAELGSGIRHMSDSLIAFQPAIEEPSNIWPSENVSSSIMPMSNVTCCHLPRGSVNRKSAYLTSLSLISFKTSCAVVIGSGSSFRHWPARQAGSRFIFQIAYSDCVQAGFPGSDSDCLL